MHIALRIKKHVNYYIAILFSSLQDLPSIEINYLVQ